MATGSIPLPPAAATLPDGSTSNLAAGMSRRQGTQTGKKAHFLTLDFDGAGALEMAFWTFRAPADYASAPALKLQWMANATSGDCKWQCQVAVVTPSDVDTPLEHAFATAQSVTTTTNATEARRLNESSLSISNTDGLSAGDLVVLVLFRDSADGSDTLTVDAELIAMTLEYTTS